MSDEIANKLRETARTLRIKPYALSDYIPLLQQAADRINELQKELQDAQKSTEAAWGMSEVMLADCRRQANKMVQSAVAATLLLHKEKS